MIAVLSGCCLVYFTFMSIHVVKNKKIFHSPKEIKFDFIEKNLTKITVGSYETK